MEQSSLVTLGLPISLFLIMMGMGLTLKLNDFKNATLAPWPLTFGTVAQVAVMPVIAYFLAQALQLDPAMTTGLVLIAACPGGTTSNLFAFLGRGDVALSILLTVVASIVTIFTLPFFVSFTMAQVMDQTVAFELPVVKTMLTLFVIVLVPTMIGMWIKKMAPEFSEKSEKATSVFGFLVLAAVIGALIVQAGDGIGGMLKQAGIAVALLNVLGLVFGLVVGRLCGLTRPQAFTVAVELGIKNGTLALMVALSLLHSPEMSVAPAVYSVFMFLFGILMIFYGRITGVGK